MIMLDTLDANWVVLGAVGFAFMGGLLAVMMFLLMRQNTRLTEAQKKIEILSANLAALCAGAVGVDKRVARLEKHGRDLQHRQENYENQGQDEHSYGEAIQMVRKGATAPRLMEELGLGRNEAELIAMLHGMKKAG